MNRMSPGVFAGGELEPGVFHGPLGPGVFHGSLIDTVLLPARAVRVEDEPDPAVPTDNPGRVLDLNIDELDH